MVRQKLIEHLDMKVFMRKDFYSLFSKHIEEFFKETGCICFGHNLIKNYRQEGHMVSTFNYNEEWHELYWEKYRNDDPCEKTCHKNALASNIGVVSWNIIDGISECAQERIEHCNVKDGCSIAYQHTNGIIENISFGWDRTKNISLDTATTLKISRLVQPLREYHLKTLFEDWD